MTFHGKPLGEIHTEYTKSYLESLMNDKNVKY